MVEIVHAKIKGRTRYSVEGLSGCEPLKKLLEERLSFEKDILAVSASIVTGNILISYNSNNNQHTIAFLIEDILNQLLFDICPGSEDVPLNPDKPTDLPDSGGVLPQESKKKLPITFNAIKRFLTPAVSQEQHPWHTLDSGTTIRLLESNARCGLPSGEADKRLAKYGPNALPSSERRSGLMIFLEQLNSLPVYLLGAAAGVSILTGGILDAAIITAVVVANAIVGYFTENEAEKTINSLKQLVHPRAEVIRDGTASELPAEAVVPGDLLVLKPGVYVAADCRIIDASMLSIDESMLTGESMPVSKQVAPLKHINTPLADRCSMAYMGTLVTGGQGIALVVATGRSTEVGYLQTIMSETVTPRTPIERQLEHMGNQLVILCGVICSIVFGIGFIRGYGVIELLRLSITLAASAVPEGLPAAATVNFALGIAKMKKHGVLVRKLQAIETLGAVKTVCLDKTGTITYNQMTVTRIYSGTHYFEVAGDQIICSPSGTAPLEIPEIQHLLMVCALCHEVKINGTGADGEHQLFGSATEKALVRLALNTPDFAGIRKKYRIINIQHRAENRLFMGTLHAASGKKGKFFSIKGSPQEVLSLCDRRMVDGSILPLTEQDLINIELENERMASDGLRVLGFAYAILDSEEAIAQEHPLIWLGLVSMSDPIRPGVKDLIRIFHQAGIEPVMITGDQSATAYAVARELEISGDKPIRILDSAELTSLDFEKLKALSPHVHVYSRVSPAHKLKIVQALQASGKTVAMTGDGINDGPALKAANIGIAMGRTGTDVAREVADIVIETDNLEILVKALSEGRTTYNNIRKSVRFFLSTNLTEILVMFAAMALGAGVPLNVMQLLWINIISDIFPGLALSRETPDPGLMNQMPRPADVSIFSQSDFRKIMVESSLISAGALSAYGYGMLRYGAGPVAGSIAFQGLTIGQLLHAFSCRSESNGIFDGQKRPPNHYLSVAVGGSLLLQLLTMVIPGLRNFLGTTPLNLLDAAVIGVTTALPFVANEAIKTLRQPANKEKEAPCSLQNLLPTVIRTNSAIRSATPS